MEQATGAAMDTEKALFDLYEAFARKLIEKARVWAEGQNISKMSIYDEANDEDSWNQPVVVTQYLVPLFKQHFDKEILNMPEAEACARAHFDSKRIHVPILFFVPKTRDPNISFEDAKRALVLYFTSTIIETLRTREQYDISAEILKNAHATILKQTSAPHARLLFTAPLIRFSSPSDCIRIDKMTGIIRLAGEDANHTEEAIQRYERGSILSGQREDRNNKFCIRSIDSIERLSENIDRAQDRIADHIVTALRLLRDGDVGVNGILALPWDMLESMISFYTTLDQSSVGQYGEDYQLTEAEVPEFLEIVKDLRQIEESKGARALRMALRRFNFAYQRINHEDRLIDYAIALECTLLHGIEEELSYRLSVRGAHFLAAKMPPDLVYTHLKKMYDVRSKIVHEGITLDEKFDRHDNKPPKIYWWPFVDRSREITRNILRRFLQLFSEGKGMEEICKEIDQEIVSKAVRVEREHRLPYPSGRHARRHRRRIDILLGTSKHNRKR